MKIENQSKNNAEFDYGEGKKNSDEFEELLTRYGEIFINFEP